MNGTDQYISQVSKIEYTMQLQTSHEERRVQISAQILAHLLAADDSKRVFTNEQLICTSINFADDLLKELNKTKP